MSLLLQILLSFTLCLYLGANFSPNTKDYDAYGLKVAANNLMIVRVDNDLGKFLIQFAPYTADNENSTDRRCSYPYEREYYIYTVVLGKNSSAYNIFFVGEMTDLDEYDRLPNRTFVGMLRYTGSNTTIVCSAFFRDIQYVEEAFAHQEHLVMTTDPLGWVAYGFSELFTFSYTAATYNLTVHKYNSSSSSLLFLPFAVDYDGNHGIIAGFLANDEDELEYSPTVVLFSIDQSTAIATGISSWSYPTNDTTWQAKLTNEGVDQYEAKFDMSVSINPTATQVLVGIQWMNMVLLFSYTNTTLTLVTSKDNGEGTIGFGKGVAWFSDAVNSFAILVNVYSRKYVWISSQIYVYNSPLTNISKPISVFPNIQQPLYSFMSSVFLNIFTTPTHLVLLDDLGYLFVILSAPKGYYSSTVGPTDEIVPAVSSQMTCIPGTYKNVIGVFPCSLCPPGTKNDGTNATLTACIDCAMDTFCPLGSVSDSISNDQLSNVIQAVAYPKSPDISGLDDILFFTLFSIGSSPRCIALSPIFWTLIVAAIVILITTVMLVIKHCVKSTKAANINNKFVALLKRTDLIREGDMWAGGLATFCVLVLCISCCVFSAKYHTSYPIETAEPSTYTCDTSIRNAKFSSSLQSSSIPVSDRMQKMIDLLNDQTVNLDVAFINTIYNCTSHALTLAFFSNVKFLQVPLNPSCKWSNYIVSYSALLPFRLITVQFTFPTMHTIGGLRIGLSASGNSQSATITLQDLGFSYTFNKTGRILGQDVYMNLQLTKIINSTSPLVSGADEILSGIWTGSFTMNYNDSFITDTDYSSTSPDNTETHLTLVISETPYYILNEQSPIARLPEIIYYNFLFITMIIGMFVLIFIIIEVMVLPCCTFLIHKCKRNSSEKYQEDSSRRSSSSHSRRQDSTQYKRNSGLVNSVTAVQEQTFTSNQHVNRGEYEEQQLPPEWNRQAFL